MLNRVSGRPSGDEMPATLSFRIARALWWIGLCWLAAGCAAAPSSGGQLFPLDGYSPTGASGAPITCDSRSLAAHIHGDPGQSPRVWLTADGTGSRLEAVWPSGYQARFAPRLEVVDEGGAVVLRDGDAVTRVCLTALPDIVWLRPPFN